MEIFTLVLLFTWLTVPVKIDGKLQQESRALYIEHRGPIESALGHARDCRFMRYAKLGGMVLFVDPHPSTSIQSVNCTCEN